jgi:hypothetical protein
MSPLEYCGLNAMAAKLGTLGVGHGCPENACGAVSGQKRWGLAA